jgi:hypothetical protein
MIIHTDLMQAVAEQRQAELRAEFARHGGARRPAPGRSLRRSPFARLQQLLHSQPAPCPTC